MTELPGALRAGLEAALEATDGRSHRIVGAEPVGGGCIHQAVRVDTDRGEAFFCKWSGSAPAGTFGAEADGLAALALATASGEIRVPAVVAHDDRGPPRWLLLEFVPPGRGRAWGAALGRGVAELHRSPRPAPDWGWERDNFIGSLPQANRPGPDWASFWRERRIAPQLERALSGGGLTAAEAAELEAVLPRIEDALTGVAREGPSLLHGDLWSGNVYPGPTGEPVLVDPAVYRGHREVDLAMSELFGGFPPGWMDAYREAWPLAPGYRAVRRPLYQLYFLLVHVNLFGRSYARAALAAARELRDSL